MRAGSAQAHPRSRGENGGVLGELEAHGGSSPLTRGKPLVQARRIREEGLIPAHAGKTTRPMRPPSRLEAHPRSRGENTTAALIGALTPGSSPLTRGKQLRVRAYRLRFGLIPAHAGKTQARPRRHRHCPAHPRSRGENDIVTRGTVAKAGSSPLTRGKPEQKAPDELAADGSSPLTRGKLGAWGAACRSARLIPAHAGKTRQHHAPRRAHRAHPRSRGENSTSSSQVGRLTGSSPLTRGKRKTINAGMVEKRLIPAHAGKTCIRSGSLPRYKAHPRSRGENFSVFPFGLSGAGSSPLTRGKLLRCRGGRWVCRLIPAHAGKTIAAFADWATSTAHPRSRGENEGDEVAEAYVSGSSPLTRGKLRK